MMATELEDRPFTAGPRERSLGGLFGDLAHEATILVRQEIELAKAEVGEKVEAMQRAGTSMAVGGAVLYAGFLVLLLALVAGLDELLARWMDTNWLSPLVVGVIAAAIGYLMLRGGQKAMQGEALVPRRTIRSLQRDVDAVQPDGADKQPQPEETR
jgi:xanthine/uracil permease